jgi:hypothetical protein
MMLLENPVFNVRGYPDFHGKESADSFREMFASSSWHYFKVAEPVVQQLHVTTV